MEAAVPLIGLSSLVVTVVNFLRYLINRDVNGAGTIGVAWAGGAGVAFLAAHANVAQSVEFAGVNLAQANWASQLLYGLVIASTGSFAVNVKQAIDRSDSATVPKFVHVLRRGHTIVVDDPAPVQ